MKHKTRAFCKGVENACRIARKIPGAYPVSGPEHDFTRALTKTRDSFFEKLVQRLPSYQIPETASLFARALHWPDVEDAHVLPDGRLLVRWTDYTEPCVMMETEYLSTIARRSADFSSAYVDDNDEQRIELIEFFRSKIKKKV